MDIKQEKEVKRINKVVVGKKCDYCGADIEPSRDYHLKYYFSVITGHRDWGNDSHESRENKDACSLDCVKKAMDEYYTDTSKTSYIEIERDQFVVEYEEGETHDAE